MREKDRRIVARNRASNLGMVKNRNACLALARGEYVKWLHADDFLCSPKALARMVAALEANRAVSLVAVGAPDRERRSREPIDTWSCFQPGARRSPAPL